MIISNRIWISAFLNVVVSSKLDSVTPKLSAVSLFIRGGNSPYIEKPEHYAAIQAQFPHAKVETVAHAGHWLHAEKTEEVLALMTEFLD